MTKKISTPNFWSKKPKSHNKPEKKLRRSKIVKYVLLSIRVNKVSTKVIFLSGPTKKTNCGFPYD